MSQSGSKKDTWVSPNVQKFGESKSVAKTASVGMLGSECGESAIRYGSSCGIRKAQGCRPRNGEECTPLRFGTDCRVSSGPSCRDRQGYPCQDDDGLGETTAE